MEKQTFSSRKKIPLWENAQKRHDIVTLVYDTEIMKVILWEKNKIAEIEIDNYIEVTKWLVEKKKEFFRKEIQITLNIDPVEWKTLNNKIEWDLKEILKKLIFYKENSEKEMNKYLDNYKGKNKASEDQIRKHNENISKYNVAIKTIRETLPQIEKEEYQKHIDQE